MISHMNTVKLTKRVADDVLYKLGILAETPELQEDYGLTQEQADDLESSVPRRGGQWTIPEWAVEAVQGELEDLVTVGRDSAAAEPASAARTRSLRDVRIIENITERI